MGPPTCLLQDRLELGCLLFALGVKVLACRIQVVISLYEFDFWQRNANKTGNESEHFNTSTKMPFKFWSILFWKNTLKILLTLYGLKYCLYGALWSKIYAIFI